MAVERTVQINIQTNAPKAAAEIAQVDRAVDNMAQTAESGVGRVERATGRLGQAAGGVRQTLRALSAPFQMLARAGFIIGAATGIAAGVGRLFGSETDSEYADRMAREDGASGTIAGLQRRGQSGAGVRSLLNERARLVDIRSRDGGNFLGDWIRGLSGGAIDPSFGRTREWDRAIASVDRQIEMIRKANERQASAAEETARNTRNILRTRPR